MRKILSSIFMLLCCSGVFADEWSIDFTAITGVADKTQVTISDAVSDGLGTVSAGDVALNSNFGLQAGTKWLYYTNGRLYQFNGGGRNFGVFNAKANQIITVNVSAALTPTNATLTNTDGNVRTYKVTADGTVIFNLARYNNIYSISVADPSATSVNYTMKYVDADGNEIQSSATKSGDAGATISVGDGDKASIYANDKKYIYDSDDSNGMTVASDGSTVVTVKFREAATYNYTVKNSLGNVIVSGSGFEADAVSYYFPYYIKTADKFYSVTGNTYGTGSLTLDADNKVAVVEYVEEENSNCVYYSEAEDISTLTSYTDDNVAIRMSNGSVAYADEAGAVITTLQPGKYTVTSASRYGTTTFYAGESVVLTLTSTGAVVTTTGDEFELSQATDITVSAGDKKNYFDYVLIRKTGDYVVPAETVTKKYQVNGTLCFEYRAEVLETSTAKVYLFEGIYNGNVYGTEVTSLEPGMPYIVLAGNLDLSYVKEDVAEEGQNSNGLIGVLDSEGYSVSGKEYMIFVGGDIYYASDEGNMVSAGHAYFDVAQIHAGAPDSSMAKALFSIDLGTATDINAVSAAQNDAPVYNIAGQRVSKAQKGIFVVNGKKVVVK